MLGDVLDDYDSIEGARRDYGIVITAGDLAVDQEMPEKLWKEMRSRAGA